MIASFDRLALRQVATRRLRAALTALGIVLGVGMVFAVLMLVGTVRHTFDDLIGSAWGSTDLVVMPEAGGALPQDSLDRIRATKGVEGAAGMVGLTAVRLDARGRVIRGMKGQMWVAGMAPHAPYPYDFRYVAGRPFRHGLEVSVERNWARDRGVRVGQRIPVVTPGGRTAVRVVGIFEFSSGLSFGGAGLAGMDETTARRLMDQPRGWNQISVMAGDPVQVKSIQRRLEAALGSGVTVKTPSEFGDSIAEQMQAFNVVLYFFSGIALFVGGFLILNSFNMTVAQRLRELGTLRTLGATRGMVMRSVLVEALVLGVLGCIGGLLAGLGLTVGLIHLMRGLGMPIGALHVGAGSAITAVVLGLVVTLASAAWPARRAGRVPPIQAVLGTGLAVKRSSWRRIAAGLVLFLPGALVGGDFWFGGGNSGGARALAGMGLTIAMLAGVAMMAPALITPLARGLALPLRHLAPTGGRLASDAIRRNPTRTAATAVALTIGLSVVVVNSAMSASMKGAISDSIDRSFARDFTVQPVGQGLEGGGAQTIPPSAVRRVAALPGVRTVAPIAVTFTKLPGLPKGQDMAVATGVDPRLYAAVDKSPIVGTSHAAALRGLASGGVLIQRGYARRTHLAVGDRLRLRGPSGVARLPVAGIVDVLSSFGGEVVVISNPTMRRLYGISQPAQLAVKLRSAADRRSVDAGLNRLVDRDYPGLEVRSSADTKADVNAKIQQQFNMFNAMIFIAVIVSLLGVINTLAMAVLERTREIGVMRALGASRWLVRRATLDESLLITVSGALAGIGVGALIAWLWLRSVSDVLPMAFRFPTGAAIGVAVAAIVLGVLASILPARRAARLKVIEALNYE